MTERAEAGGSGGRARSGAAIVLALIAVCSTSRPVRAQCAVCGNPAFATGDNDVARTFAAGAGQEMRLTAGLIYASQSYADLYTGTRPVSAEDKTAIVFTPDWALQVHLATLLAGVELPSGTELAMVLPMGVASATRLPHSGPGTTKDSLGNPLITSHDAGLSDLELRVRQRLGSLLSGLPEGLPTVLVAVGAVAPTGSFLVKDPEGAVTDQYVSLGRGAWWAVADLDVLGRIGERLGWVLSLGSRIPLTQSENDGYLFRWGPEVRTTAALTASVVPGRLHASLGAEWQWRDSGKERIFADVPIEDFPNGGGHWLTLQPTVQVQVGGGVALTAAARVPLWRDVNGIQPVPGLGLIAGLGWSWQDAAPRPAEAPTASTVVSRPTAMPQPGQAPTDPLILELLAPGRVTVVDWWAEWCAVCKELAPELDRWAAGRPDVAVRKVDVTGWDAERMAPYLSDAPGLPVIDVYDAQGRFVKRLWGAAARGFAGHVPAAEATP